MSLADRLFMEYDQRKNALGPEVCNTETMMELAQLVITEDDDFYTPTEEDERNHWSGRGDITFRVGQNIKDTFEIEVIDHSGCAGGLDETMGIEYYIEHVWGLHTEVPLKEGVTYHIKGVTVEWIRGDGWEIDGDVEYDYEEIIAEWKVWSRTKTVLFNLWWQNIGWKIRQWRMKK